MSDENVELVLRNYEAINAIGRTGEEFVDPEETAPDLWARLDPGFELHDRSDIPDARVYRGAEEAKKFWRKIQELFAEARWEPGEITDLGHAVVVEVEMSLLGRGSEVPLKAAETDVFWFRGDKLVRLQGFATKEEAMAAAAEPVS
jgi:hypothetical protein